MIPDYDIEEEIESFITWGLIIGLLLIVWEIAVIGGLQAKQTSHNDTASHHQ